MRFFNFLLIALFLNSPGNWETDFEHAKEIAKQQHKFILLNFSGSDWCGPCIRLNDEYFEIAMFKEFADSSLVLLNADFPRKKKHQLSKEQQKKNDQLAEQFNPHGIFPCTLLLDKEGKLLFTWEGFPDISPAHFISQAKILMNARE
ncbi:MAG TPA: thioredoxin family protein [Chitinophagaceae bacterium]|nr:thioredoxin family protein [Chitinophagaceae bacterium]